VASTGLAAGRAVSQHDPRLREEELGRANVGRECASAGETSARVREQGPAVKPGQVRALG
jgi:hypothetical protein